MTATIHNFPVSDAQVINAIAAFSGKHREGMADAHRKLAALSTIRATAHVYETWLLERVTRGGFSYSDEADALHDLKQAFAALEKGE